MFEAFWRNGARSADSASASFWIRHRSHSSLPKNKYKNYKNIIAETSRPGVGLVTFNQPRTLNTLSHEMLVDMNDALDAYEADDTIGSVVLTGIHKSFAVGADIKAMLPMTGETATKSSYFDAWTASIRKMQKPLIAAVNGYALGGGCEIGLMCDILYCSRAAIFAQPEVNIGIIPGAGGSQRLARAVGKSRAADLILTGRRFDGVEAEKWGVAARLFDTPAACLEGALDSAQKIASMSRTATAAAKNVLMKSQEAGLAEGLDHERLVFNDLFDSQDQKIGMQAFLDKRTPRWAHE